MKFMCDKEFDTQRWTPSPFLSNVVLNEWDKELERRGHRFVRYGDDCIIYVTSHRAGERVMANLRGFITGRLKLRVNEAKSAVDVPQRRKFLGFSFRAGRAIESTQDCSGIATTIQGSGTSVDAS